MISDQKIRIDTMPTTASAGETRPSGLAGLRGDIERIEGARADVAEHDAHGHAAPPPPTSALFSLGTASTFAVALPLKRPSRTRPALTGGRDCSHTRAMVNREASGRPRRAACAALPFAEERIAETSAKAPAKRLWGVGGANRLAGGGRFASGAKRALGCWRRPPNRTVAAHKDTILQPRGFHRMEAEAAAGFGHATRDT